MRLLNSSVISIVRRFCFLLQSHAELLHTAACRDTRETLSTAPWALKPKSCPLHVNPTESCTSFPTMDSSRNPGSTHPPPHTLLGSRNCSQSLTTPPFPTLDKLPGPDPLGRESTMLPVPVWLLSSELIVLFLELTPSQLDSDSAKHRELECLPPKAQPQPRSTQDTGSSASHQRSLPLWSPYPSISEVLLTHLVSGPLSPREDCATAPYDLLAPGESELTCSGNAASASELPFLGLLLMWTGLGSYIKREYV